MNNYITTPGDQTQYLLDYKNGRIPKGLKIGAYIDEHLVFKRGQLCIILGHDNVGKSYFINYYFLCLALKHDLKICMYSAENHKGKILRDLVQMYSGKKYNDLTDNEILKYSSYIEQFFLFVNSQELYKPGELLEIFEQSECDIALIDPYTALDRDMSYNGNYQFLNSAREFTNRTGITLYINTHPISESGRAGNLYPKGHEWEGHLKPPLKSDCEGGKAFLNRCDDMFIIHRLEAHKTMKYYTMLQVVKVKDIDSGGMHTDFNEPILAEFNNGLGFKFRGVDPLQDIRPKPIFNNRIF